jgi:hypothetical protein
VTTQKNNQVPVASTTGAYRRFSRFPAISNRFDDEEFEKSGPFISIWASGLGTCSLFIILSAAAFINDRNIQIYIGGKRYLIINCFAWSDTTPLIFLLAQFQNMADFVEGNNETEVPDEVAAMFDLTQKKKKKKKKTTDAADVDVAKDGEELQEKVAVGSVDLDPPIYTYTQLLNRVVDLLHQNNPELTEKRRYTMKPPQLMRGRLLFA